MKATRLLGSGRSSVDIVPAPVPGPTEVLVALEGSGVCASSLPLWEGRPWFRYPAPPGSPGHEGWGTVTKVGGEVRRIVPGERVALLSQHAFAEFDVADETAVVRLPDVLRGRHVPGEPLACAVNACRRAAVPAGGWVVVIGIGFLGAVLTRLLTSAGARVVAVSRRPFARALAERYGASASLPFADPATVAGMLRECTGDAEAPVVFEAVGTQPALDLATELAGVRGQLLIAGYHQDGLRTVDLQKWNWKGLDVVNAHERETARYAEGMRAAVALLASGELDVTPLLGEPLPLDRVDTAFQLIHDRPDGFVKAVVVPQ